MPRAASRCAISRGKSCVASSSATTVQATCNQPRPSCARLSENRHLLPARGSRVHCLIVPRGSLSGPEIHLRVPPALGMKRAYPLETSHALCQLFPHHSLRPRGISLVGVHGGQKQNVTRKRRMLDTEDMKWLAA